MSTCVWEKMTSHDVEWEDLKRRKWTKCSELRANAKVLSVVQLFL